MSSSDVQRKARDYLCTLGSQTSIHLQKKK